MELREILRRTDHTLLAPAASWDEIREACDDAVRFETAGVCIPPSFVERAAKHVEGKVKVCTVLAFPNGYSTAASKVFEAAEAVKYGADELDVVINLGMVKERRMDALLSELQLIKAFCEERVLKVIVETCLLTQEEKLALCDVVSASGADYIKTSTGFSCAGATLEDVRLFKARIAPHLKIKAAGGIRTLEDARAFLEAGADRLGASALVPLAKQREAGV